MSADIRGGGARWFYRFYKRAVSPILHALSPTQCTFLPTCSEYAYVAVARHGVVLGSGLAFRRLIRCHPWSPGGFDPVPERPGSNPVRQSSPGMGESHDLS